jgi:uncharacterized protein YjbJ (UPF0337 family)
MNQDDAYAILDYDNLIKFEIEQGGLLMNDLKDKITDATKNIMDAEDKLAHDMKTNNSEMKGKLDAMNDKAKGKFNQTKGAVKTKIGNLTDNNKLKSEGLVDTVVGKTQEISGNIKETINDATHKHTK